MKTVTFSVPDWLRDLIDRCSDLDDRSKSSYLRHLILEDARTRGAIDRDTTIYSRGKAE